VAHTLFTINVRIASHSQREYSIVEIKMQVGYAVKAGIG